MTKIKVKYDIGDDVWILRNLDSDAEECSKCGSPIRSSTALPCKDRIQSIEICVDSEENIDITYSIYGMYCFFDECCVYATKAEAEASHDKD